MDAGRDAGAPPERCDRNEDCDDTFPCTIDECIVGNVCTHDPIDARCTAPDRCIVGRGCVTGSPSDCQRNEDCDDGLVCDGPEECIGQLCFEGTPRNCADGNDCTIDMCDNDVPGGCHYETAAGCDAGPTSFDGGTPCETFSAERDYSGAIRMLPSQSCFAGLVDYTIRSLGFSIEGDTLTVVADRFRLTQTPAPVGASFDVSGSDGCASVRLVGTFVCSNHFEGTWTANHFGDCSACAPTSASVDGVR